MPLFQKSVVTKHLQNQDSPKLFLRWNIFKNHFLNPHIQENIRSSKEEQYQGEFLIDLFVNVLGYTKNPAPNFNLTTEFKNVKDRKKADGAILIDGQVKAVIELKGTNTTDLNKIEIQAFGYKNNQPECTYVITSNFEKLRFYIDNATEHLEFNIFELTEKEFDLLYLCLAYENIQNDIPKKLKEQSATQEKNITKFLYIDYSLFKRELHQNLVLLNPTFDGLELFKISQKLLDRFLFILFAEDRNLLPTNLIFRINKEWRQLREMRMSISLYERYKMYFNDLNIGAKVVLPAFSQIPSHTKEVHQIFAYNGGLFRPDNLLDTIVIDDEILFTHTQKLSKYDFQSEIDVNILGHIFENSLNELDEIRAQLDGQIIVKAATKRKKDGVFYTPKYITKYIVDQTVGKLCEDKKSEFGIIEEQYFADKRRNIITKKPLIEKLNNYRNWLLQITICDPACGSGAFLNQALDFLISEHRYIDELQSKLLGEALVLSDIEKSILENNLFGVDLNEESVEIAKLSLWLRTARPNRKLNDLNHNIKCGNSLIDDEFIAAEKAFNWQLEFPKIFESGGFDIIIGNPPYIQSHALSENAKAYIYKNYSCTEYQINTYAVFTEKIIKITKQQGLYSIIIPNYWLSTKYDSKLRELVFLRNTCLEVVNMYMVFEDATVDTLILTGRKDESVDFPKKTNIYSVSKSLESIDKRLMALAAKEWSFEEIIEFEDLESKIKISFEEKLNLRGGNVIGDFMVGYKGMQPYEMGKGMPVQTREMMNNRIYHSNVKVDETFFPLIGSGNVQRYKIRIEDSFIKYGKNLAAPRKFEIFSGPRILVNRILSKNKIDASYIDEIVINNTDVFNFLPKSPYDKYLKAILAILSSSVCSTYFINSNVNLSRQAFPKLNVSNILEFPLPDISDEILLSLSQNVNIMLTLNEELQEQSHKFQRTVLRKFKLESLSKRLNNWYSLNYVDFLKELGKLKINLSLIQEVEWEEYFINEAHKTLAIKDKIDKSDEAIEQIVYQLYNLTPEEILIVKANK